MTQHSSEDQITLYAAGELDAAEADAVRAHLRQGCPVCAGRLAESQAVLAEVMASLPPVTPSSRVYEKIQSALRWRRPRGERFKRLWIGVTSGCAAAAITFAVTRLATRPTRELLRSNDLRLVSLAGSDNAARGRVLWDQEHHRWQVAVFDLHPLPPGKTYELWFITADQQKVRAVTFDTDAAGTAALMVNVPPNLHSLAMAAITDEPAGGSAQPTGAIRLAGKIPS